MRPEVAVALMGGVAGCSGSRPTPVDSGTPVECEPGIELGTGVETFEPVAEGDEIRMVFGPQGGFHLPLALRGCGVGEPLRTHVTGVVVDDGQVVVDVSLTHVWVVEDPCCGVLLDLRGYLFVDDYEWSPTSLDGRRVGLDFDGTELAEDEAQPFRDHVEVVVRAP